MGSRTRSDGKGEAVGCRDLPPTPRSSPGDSRGSAGSWPLSSGEAEPETSGRGRCFCSGRNPECRPPVLDLRLSRRFIARGDHECVSQVGLEDADPQLERHDDHDVHAHQRREGLHNLHRSGSAVVRGGALYASRDCFTTRSPWVNIRAEIQPEALPVPADDGLGPYNEMPGPSGRSRC